MKREIVVIDENKCTGCGLCIPNCHEGALQIIDGKARLISDLYCDGLGACLGHCPVGAMIIEEREVAPYDEKKVMIDNIIPAGENTIKAHLNHLKDHNATEFLNIAIETLKEKGVKNPIENTLENLPPLPCGCPGTHATSFKKENNTSECCNNLDDINSQLTHWPIQLHLLSPQAPYLKNSDLLLAADCVSYALGGFHSNFLKGKTLAIACPKLDSGLDKYKEKLIAMIDNNNLNTITCITMEVPCCMGLIAIAKEARSSAKRKIPLKHIIVTTRGEILSDSWID